MDSKLRAIYEFTKQIGAFKEIERFRGQYYWRDYPVRQRYESDADHSWRMAMVVMLLQTQLPDSLDLAKALKMALIHDLPELIAGDPSPLGETGTGEDSHAYNTSRIDQKHADEQAAFKRLVRQLPSELGQELYDIWNEFEEGQTYEAKIVRAIDKWEAKLQVLEYTDGKMFPAHLDFTLKYRAEYFADDPVLQELMDILEHDFKSRFREYKKDPH